MRSEIEAFLEYEIAFSCYLWLLASGGTFVADDENANNSFLKLQREMRKVGFGRNSQDTFRIWQR